jgi:glutathione synthase/RimK-type ligase-like ATP-grasp enzyme
VAAPAPVDIYLLTHSEDFFTVDRVADEVRALKGKPVRLDTDAFPRDASLSVRLGRARPRVAWTQGKTTHHLERAHAFWVRRLWPSAPLATMDVRWAAAADAATRTALVDALQRCEQARFVNPLGAAERAESKLLQLELARRFGLRAPDTLVTNAPPAVQGFAGRRKVVTKLLVPVVQSMTGHPLFHYTQALTPRDLAALQGLEHAPQIFQPRVEKQRELRAIYVGGTFFVGAIESDGAVDWRRSAPAERTRWSIATLPRDVARRAHRLMQRLGLSYGALDFIVTPKGEHVFLEVNPSGEWGWLERDLGLPIARALARLLVRGRA